MLLHLSLRAMVVEPDALVDDHRRRIGVDGNQPCKPQPARASRRAAARASLASVGLALGFNNDRGFHNQPRNKPGPAGVR